MTVNNTVVDDPAFQVNTETDVITLDGKPLPEPEHIYLLMNKPSKTVTTAKDEYGRRTVLDLLDVQERVYPVGRLDYDTCGVLLLTNDGDLANRLMHPKFAVSKTYRAELDEALDHLKIAEIRRGIAIGEGERVKPDALRKSPGRGGKEYVLTLHEGKKHEVKRIFRAVGRRVIKLERMEFAGITSDKLRPGEWRFLNPGEVLKLKKIASLAE